MSLGGKNSELKLRGSSILEIPFPGDLFLHSRHLASELGQRDEREAQT